MTYTDKMIENARDLAETTPFDPSDKPNVEYLLHGFRRTIGRSLRVEDQEQPLEVLACFNDPVSQRV